MSTEPIEINKAFLSGALSNKTHDAMFAIMRLGQDVPKECMRACLLLAISQIAAFIVEGKISRSDVKGILSFVEGEIYASIIPFLKSSTQESLLQNSDQT